MLPLFKKNHITNNQLLTKHVEETCSYLINKRNKRSEKGMDVNYTELKMQGYLKSGNIDI